MALNIKQFDSMSECYGAIGDANEKLGNYNEAFANIYKALELTLQPTFTLNATTKIGLGWFMVARKGNEYINHSGGTGGYRSILVIDRKNKRAVIILNNAASDVSEMGFQLMDLLNAK